MIGGPEFRHIWTPPDAAESAVTLYSTEDDGSDVYPRVDLESVDIQKLAEPTDNFDENVGEDGTTPRGSNRRSKQVTYSGLVKSRAVDGLKVFRDYQQTLRDAFDDNTAEGRMDVTPHPSNPWFTGDEGDRYYNARALTLEMPDGPSTKEEYRSQFTLTLRNHDGRHFGPADPDYLKQRIRALDPELYWAMDSIDGLDDLSGNSRDGTPQAGLVVGGGAGITAITGDESTDFPGVDEYIQSAYSPFVNGGAITVIGMIDRDDTDNAPIFMGDGASIPAAWINSPNTPRFDPQFGGTIANDDFADFGAIWPSTDATAFGLIFDEPSNAGEFFINGASAGNGIANQAYGTSGNLRVGIGPFMFLGGRMSHFAVFSRALTPDEIAEIAEIETTGIRPFA